MGLTSCGGESRVACSSRVHLQRLTMGLKDGIWAEAMLPPLESGHVRLKSATCPISFRYIIQIHEEGSNSPTLHVHETSGDPCGSWCHATFKHLSQSYWQFPGSEGCRVRQQPIDYCELHLSNHICIRQPKNFVKKRLCDASASPEYKHTLLASRRTPAPLVRPSSPSTHIVTFASKRQCPQTSWGCRCLPILRIGSEPSPVLIRPVWTVISRSYFCLRHCLALAGSWAASNR